MNERKRPLAVTILACLYIAVGALGFVYHLGEFLRNTAFVWDIVLIELTEFLAVLFGAFMLWSRNWARWVALAWMLFHVILSAFHAVHEFAIPTVFLSLIAWLLFRPDASRYFRTPRSERT